MLLSVAPAFCTPPRTIKGKPVEAGVDQRHRALRFECKSGRRTVRRIEHQSVGDDSDGFTGVAQREFLQRRTAARERSGGAFTTGHRILRIPRHEAHVGLRLAALDLLRYAIAVVRVDAVDIGITSRAARRPQGDDV